jgi:ubiquinone/menaquinone biosynthesis C-methylase UbiE
LRTLIRIFRPALVLLVVFLAVGAAALAFRGIRTLQTLTAVEAERDQWQRPVEVIQALDLKPGGTVVDFGSGAGYFALKLSDAVGPKGEVIAVDLRRFSLFFLHLRALLQGKHNIQIIVGEPDDPHLPEARVNSILIANTYHELTAPESTLRHVSRALRPGGHLVIVDRSEGSEHPISPGSVEMDLRKQGFEIMSRDDGFIKRTGDEAWWLIVAAKP